MRKARTKTISVPMTSRHVYEIISNSKGGYYDQNMEIFDSKDVNGGSWVLIIRDVDVASFAPPMTYGIYWALPYKDPFDRQSCIIHTQEDIVLLNHEYTVLTDEKVEQYRALGYRLHECGRVEHELNMEIIEKGRDLVEEEREIIWALQLDGLNEEQACEEYFLSKHTDYNNYTICYLPTKEMYYELLNTFGGYNVFKNP